MAQLKIAIAGANGRMGRTLVQAVEANPNTILVGALDLLHGGGDEGGGDAAVGKQNRLIRVGRGNGIVRHHNHGLAKHINAVAQKAQHLRTGYGIQITRRLVSENHRRLSNKRTGNSDTLLLSTRHFMWFMR